MCPEPSCRAGHPTTPRYWNGSDKPPASQKAATAKLAWRNIEAGQANISQPPPPPDLCDPISVGFSNAHAQVSASSRDLIKGHQPIVDLQLSSRPVCGSFACPPSPTKTNKVRQCAHRHTHSLTHSLTPSLVVIEQAAPRHRISTAEHPLRPYVRLQAWPLHQCPSPKASRPRL